MDKSEAKDKKPALYPCAGELQTWRKRIQAELWEIRELRPPVRETVFTSKRPSGRTLLIQSNQSYYGVVKLPPEPVDAGSNSGKLVGRRAASTGRLKETTGTRKVLQSELLPTAGASVVSSAGDAAVSCDRPSPLAFRQWRYVQSMNRTASEGHILLPDEIATKKLCENSFRLVETYKQQHPGALQRSSDML
eukprot:gnl/MRDRNA2_/MRDRNA2_131524_c0_seq1.p1 gnl/MRDRNA2_/MRDRNA2_131524_c0~~gnl/MRDRNA2_/MRDRNA2_131524_c0_seq1.p1  ORF type:complete len:192 (-),score=31.06 gnl/MRDRNA2_/MRDRNA2_131524_c0_seq1:43-618(-)